MKELINSELYDAFNHLVSMVYIRVFQCFNPLAAKLFNLNFYPLEVVSRWRDPQLQVSENYSDLTKIANLAD